MNFSKKLAVLALVAIVLLTAPAAQAQQYIETQSPFWGQMNSIADGFDRPMNSIRRALGQPERVRQPLFDDRVIVRVDPRNQYLSSQYYAPQGAYYGGYQGSGAARFIQALSGGQQIPPQYQGMSPCDLPLEYRPIRGSDTPDCGQYQATERSVNVWGAVNTGATLIDGILTRRSIKKENEKTRESIDGFTNAITKELEKQDIQERPAAPAPIRPQPVSPSAQQQVPQSQGRGTTIKVVNCTGEILKVAGENPGESWTLQVGESKDIASRNPLALKATYNGQVGLLVVANPTTIAFHPSN